MLERTVWMTVAEAAEFLGVTDGRVRQWLLANELSGKKFGATWAISKADVEKFAKKPRPKGNPNFLKRTS